MLHWVRRSYSW